MRGIWTRRLGLFLIVAGMATLAWAVTVWQWRDPLSSLYTSFQQRELEERYEALARSAKGADDHPIRQLARAYRVDARKGDPIGRLHVPRLNLDVILVNGTDAATLKKGPGRDPQAFMPGEGQLVYIAGHRTTYLAPFGRIDDLRRGDRISIEMPYGTFTYAVTRHRVVDDEDVSVLRTTGREVVRLQACHPRFFATQRYIVDARPVPTTG
jgi:sortase A